MDAQLQAHLEQSALDAKRHAQLKAGILDNLRYRRAMAGTNSPSNTDPAEIWWQKHRGGEMFLSVHC